MASPARLFLIGLVTACLIAGGGVLYLDVGHDPMSYYSVTGGFDYQYAIVSALIAGLSLGPFLFLVGLILYGIGCVVVLGFQLLLGRK